MDDKAAGNLAGALKALRQTRRLSIEKVADRARAQNQPIAPSTLRRWETGDIQPQIGSLNIVFEILGVDEHERNAVLSLLDAPRGVAARRNGSGRDKQACGPTWYADLEDWDAWLPAVGDLWRAMRMRRGITGVQLADGLGVAASHITRIEQSRLVPDEELRARLFAALGANEAEQQALSGSRVTLHTPPEYAVPLDTLGNSLVRMLRQWERGTPIPGDLFFLCLESRLWPLAQHDSEALRSLALTWTHHANTLMWQNRFEEMNRYAERVLLLAEQKRVPCADYCIWSATLCARHRVARTVPQAFRRSEVAGGQRKGYQQALEVLDCWMDAPITHNERIWLLRDRATYMGELGMVEQAQTLLRASRAEACRHSLEPPIVHADFVEARLLARNGRAREALPLLLSMGDRPERQRIQDIYVLAQTFRALGEVREAERALTKMEDLVAVSGVERERWRIEELQQQLQS